MFNHLSLFVLEDGSRSVTHFVESAYDFPIFHHLQVYVSSAPDIRDRLWRNPFWARAQRNGAARPMTTGMQTIHEYGRTGKLASASETDNPDTDHQAQLYDLDSLYQAHIKSTLAQEDFSSLDTEVGDVRLSQGTRSGWRLEALCLLRGCHIASFRQASYRFGMARTPCRDQKMDRRSSRFSRSAYIPRRCLYQLRLCRTWRRLRQHSF
jgi:hypothetical protein